MKARIDYFCRPPKKDGIVEEVEIHIFVDLPVTPFNGMMIKVTPKGDYLKVSDVMLDLTPDGEGLIVGMEEPQDDLALRPWKEMKEEGWALS